MRLLPGAAAACLLLALLTWLLLRGISTGSAEYSTTVRTFDDFALAEASLHRDVLLARAGLLQDYDPVNAAMAQIDSAVARLRSEALKEGLDAAQVDRLAGATGLEDELTERFKSDNALLRNSLSYVGLLSTNPDFVERIPLLAMPIGALAAAILQLTLDSSTQSRQAVQNRIVELAELTPIRGPDRQGAQALIAHAHLLENVVPTVDDTLNALFAVPTRPPLEETRALFSDRQKAAEASAQRFRLLLYATSLLLVVALVDLGRRLRAREVALRKRAAFEHLIAENSTSLINCPPGETESRLTQALGELGKAMGMDRVYVALAETPVRVYVWSADGSPYPSGWPEAALTLPEDVEEIGLGTVRRAECRPAAPGRRQDDAHEVRRARLGLRVAADAGTRSGHLGLRHVVPAGVGSLLPARRGAARGRRHRQCDRARVVRARPRETHRAARACASLADGGAARQRHRA